MTCCVTITRAVSNKETDTYIPSPISKLFSGLIGKLAVAIEAERDIETINPHHPSCDRWITESEAAWSDVTDLHLALAQEPLLRAEDQPLRMLASLINRRCGVESADELRDLQGLVARKSHWLICPGHGATAARITSMLGQGRHLLEVIDTLDVFQPLADMPDAPSPSFEA